MVKGHEKEKAQEEEITPVVGDGASQAEETVETAPIDEEEMVIDTLALTKELDETRARANEYLDGWQRARAEFANYRKRVERDQAQLYQTTAGSIIKRYLDISDDLERALKNRPKGGDGSAWADGIELIYRKFLAILENEGVKPMQLEGQFFDPNYHEAISEEESPNHKSGQIIEVLQAGYLLGERVLRPAKVRIAR